MTSSFSNKYRYFSMLAMLFLCLSLFGCKQDKEAITIQGKKLRLETAQTMDEKTRGLSGRKSLGKNSGMIFHYEQTETLSFWMKDTLIPLQIVFINGCEIVDIQEMSLENDPGNPQRTYYSKQPANKAIELNPATISQSAVGTLVDEFCF